MKKEKKKNKRLPWSRAKTPYECLDCKAQKAVHFAPMLVSPSNINETGAKRAGRGGEGAEEGRREEPGGGKLGRAGETWGELGRARESWGYLGRAAEGWGDLGRAGHQLGQPSLGSKV